MKATILGALLALLCLQSAPAQTALQRGISFNGDYVRTLGATLDLDSPIAVFRHVFGALDSAIHVYPTEGYYYFAFNANGARVSGNIGFFADLRRTGRFNFGYFEESIVDASRMWFDDDLVRHGVVLEQLDAFTYLMTFEGRTVRVHLNDISRPASSRVAIGSGEEYVGTTFDESGLSFYLLFDRRSEHLYWVLNEDIDVAESFVEVDGGIMIGRRTAFAFHRDSLGRRVLFGVLQSNVDRNTPFDGPFDQLPDSQVLAGRLDLRRYLEAAYPHAEGRIDEYGNYLDDEGSRIAVSSYFIYSRVGELKRLMALAREASGSESELLTQLTRERETGVLSGQ